MRPRSQRPLRSGRGEDEHGRKDGELYYNANGSGSGILFAKLATGLGVTNADFVAI